MGFALPPGLLDALKYTGDKVASIPCVNEPRAPTTTDRNYPLFTFWRNSSKTATAPNAEGDVWYLARFDGSTNPASAIWLKLSSGTTPGGTVLTLSDTASTAVAPDSAGNIQLTAGTGVSITSTPASNLITIGLSGGSTAVDSIAVQANSAPGTNPVVPDSNGLVTVNGAVVAAHSVPLETRSRAANAYNVEAQVASLVSPTPANTNSVGLACYNTNQFQLDSTSGMVSLKGSTTLAPVLTLTGDSGGAISPTAGGNITTAGTSSQIITTGAGNTITHSLFGGAAVSSFYAWLDADVANATGDGTGYNVICNQTKFNVGSNYDTTTGRYTAPKDGKYLFCATLSIADVDAAHTTGRYFISIQNSGGSTLISQEFAQQSPAACRNVDNNFAVTGSVIVSMSTGDTAKINVTVNGGTKTVTVNGSNTTVSSPFCSFSGELLS